MSTYWQVFGRWKKTEEPGGNRQGEDAKAQVRAADHGARQPQHYTSVKKSS